MDDRFLLREALTTSRGDVGLEELRYHLERRLKSGDLIRNKEKITSKQTLHMELAVVNWASRGRRQFAAMGQAEDLGSLTPHQKSAVATILSSLDRVVIMQGDAGTGKSSSLKYVVQGIEKQGGLVFACAPSSGATENLRRELSCPADTLQQLLVNSELQQKMRSRTLIVDEASLISVRQMHDLCVVADQQNCRLILVGDIKQHSSVQAGDALRALQKYGQVETVRLSEIHRQRNPEYRKVVSLLAKGEAYKALAQLEGLGGVIEEKGMGQVLDQAARGYVQKTLAGQSCLAVIPVWAEINAFTAELRPKLKEAGLLEESEQSRTTFHSYAWSTAHKKDASNYLAGDTLIFHRKVGPFAKNEAITVIEQQGRSLLVERADGSRLTFDPKPNSYFEVGLSTPIPVAVGERLLMRANCPDAKVYNGEIVEVVGKKEDGGLALKDGRQLPPQFNQFLTAMPIPPIPPRARPSTMAF